MADQVLANLTAPATSDTSIITQVFDVGVKTITGGAANEFFRNSDMKIAAALGGVGGAALQGWRANKRIENAVATGVAQKFKFALL